MRQYTSNCGMERTFQSYVQRVRLKVHQIDSGEASQCINIVVVCGNVCCLVDVGEHATIWTVLCFMMLIVNVCVCVCKRAPHLISIEIAAHIIKRRRFIEIAEWIAYQGCAQFFFFNYGIEYTLCYNDKLARMNLLSVCDKYVKYQEPNLIWLSFQEQTFIQVVIYYLSVIK